MEGSKSPNEQSNNVGHAQEQKMNIFLKVIKTVSFSVKKSDTVGNVKAILADKEGMSECGTNQSLFFSGECLRDDQKLVDCGIQENSMLQVFVPEPLRLFVKAHHDKVIVIEARPCETIEKVKSSIMAKEGIRDSGSFNLIYAGKQLAEDRTLESLHVQGDSTLHMVSTPKLGFTVRVKMPSGEILRMEVKLWYTVGDVRIVVESVFGSPVDHLSFVCNGVHLDDSKSLSLYNITENSMLEMVLKSIQIFVDQSGKKSAFDACPEDLVMTLRKRICDKEFYYLNNVKLCLDGRYLCDHRTLASYDIENGETIDMILSTSGGSGSESLDEQSKNMDQQKPKSIQIFVKSFTGKKLAFDVYPEDLVIDLKKMICDEEFISLHNILLFFDGMLLRDHETLASNDIENGDTLYSEGSER